MAMNHIKLWSGFGSCVTVAAGVTLASASAAPSAFTSAGGVQIAQGGEAGETDFKPSSYRLLSNDPKAYAFDVRPQAAHYAELVQASYAASVADAETLRAMIRAMLDAPSAATLDAARKAWVAARPAYLVTEAFRFYDGPIDQAANGDTGPEPHLNAWPLNEAFIDYVKGRPDAGLVNDTRTPLTRESILSRDQVSDEADVTTGWHAIEFLLWGQDLDPSGPGQRPYTDYLPGDARRDRRRLYLATITDMLVDDLRSLQAAWATGSRDNYRARWDAMDPREALGRAVNGLANLLGHELPIERLSVALDSGDQEDEHSCFSDTTHQDHLYDLRGAYNIWLGSRGDTPDPAGLRALVLSLDPALAQRTDRGFAKALAAVAAMDQPFDSILRAAPGSPPRQRAEAFVTALHELAAELARVGRRLGVLVIVPGLETGTG